MIRGFTGSLLLHGGLLAWAVLGFSMSTPLPQPEEIAVEVAEISTLADVTKQMKGDTTAKNNEAAPAPDKPQPVVMKEAPKPTPAPPPPPPAAAEPPPPEPVKAPEPPKPEPPKAAEVPPAEDKQALEEMLAAEESRLKAEAAAKAEAAKVAAAAKAKAEADAKKKLAAEKLKKELAEKKKREDDEKKKLAALAAQPKDFTRSIASAIEGAKAPELLDKTPKPRGAPPVSAQTASANPNAAKGPNAGSSTGTDSVNQARDQDMLKSQITAALRECWNKPSAGGGVTAPAVTIKWTLSNNGSLSSEPRVMQSDRNSPLADQAERAAIRAVQACSPFKLKPELYSIWREITWVFDPNKAF